MPHVASGSVQNIFQGLYFNSFQRDSAQVRLIPLEFMIFWVLNCPWSVSSLAIRMVEQGLQLKKYCVINMLVHKLFCLDVGDKWKYSQQTQHEIRIYHFSRLKLTTDTLQSIMEHGVRKQSKSYQPSNNNGEIKVLNPPNICLLMSCIQILEKLSSLQCIGGYPLLLLSSCATNNTPLSIKSQLRFYASREGVRSITMNLCIKLFPPWH